MSDEKPEKKQRSLLPSQLVAIEKAKENRRIKMWNMRNSFIIQGHQCLQRKFFAEAVICFEKYIRTLEIIFGVNSGELSPDHFKEASQTAELSIVAGVYWELVKIYDSSEKYAERQIRAATQLAKFAHLTPLHSELVRQAEIFLKTAKQPQNVKVFISGGKKPSRCFIASAAFNSPTAYEVLVLRDFRDQRLKSNFWGRKFIYFYYLVSPRIACILDRHTYLKKPTRWALRTLIKCVSLI